MGPSAKSFCGTAGKNTAAGVARAPIPPRGARGFRSGAVRRPVAPGPHTPGRAAVVGAVDGHSKTRPPHPGAGRRFRRFTRFRTPLRGDGRSPRQAPKPAASLPVSFVLPCALCGESTQAVLRAVARPQSATNPRNLRFPQAGSAAGGSRPLRCGSLRRAILRVPLCSSLCASVIPIILAVPPAGAGPKSAPIGGIGGFPRRRRRARKKKKAGGPAFP